MTFSIAARCPSTGMHAIAVCSSSPAVAARCAHARAGVGTVATQNITDPMLGPRGLDLMAAGLTAEAALARLIAESPHIAFRQLHLVDRHGGTASHSGARTLGTHAVHGGRQVIAAGNLLASTEVPRDMVAAYQAAGDDHVCQRILTAMRAAMDAGGEAGPVHSAGLLLVRDVAWPIADLRVDWHDTDPIGELTGLWHRWQPQMEGYVTRALDPVSAPTFGVPGDR